jgi:hypothetical protein
MEGKHDLLQEDENDVKKSTSGITTEEVEANLKHDEGMNATTTISRHALCLLTLHCMLIAYNFIPTLKSLHISTHL